jgi:hypothetical protein
MVWNKATAEGGCSTCEIGSVKKKKTVLLSAPENTCPSIPAKKNRLAERGNRRLPASKSSNFARFFPFCGKPHGCGLKAVSSSLKKEI